MPAKPFWQKWPFLVLLGMVGLTAVTLFSTPYESYNSLYDATYIGSEACGECHKIIYARWQESPHANMTHPAASQTVVGDFENASWTLPAAAQHTAEDKIPVAKMYHEGEDYYMALRQPGTQTYTPFKIAYVIGYQYRQTYLTREEGGVLRRLPLEWSVSRQEFFPYWNFQEHSEPSLPDLWAQMTSLNSAWNLFCARCHTTHLTVVAKNAAHTMAQTDWVDDGIACEACHGPGSQHQNYFAGNYVNRLVAFANSRFRGQPVAYIANGPKLTKGQDLSICGRCHGPDILMSTTDIYRDYEPGYSASGHINDLSPYFQQTAIEPGRTAETVEVWSDGDPKGIAMIFRSFIESTCYQQAEVRCYNCHDPHSNKSAAVTGILEPSVVSNAYCLKCHTELQGAAEASHTHHEEGTEGSFCYDCHMPKEILNIASGLPHYTRTHWMSSLPDPENSVRFGLENAPNACNNCHTEQTPAWAVDKMSEWWGPNSN